MRKVVVVVLPEILPVVVLLVELRDAAVICLFAVSLICFSVSAALGAGLLVGGFDRAGAVVGLGFKVELVVVFGDVAEVDFVVL